MSHENVELARRLVEVFNRRELEIFVAITTPDFQWTTSMMAVEGELFRGREGIETYFGRMSESWEEFQFRPDAEVDPYRDLGDKVLVSGQIEGRGLISGVPVSSPLDILLDMRDGKISKMHSFLDHDQALRAAGLAS
jgi:ketosteroid isomerase-like protein